jgi:osmoprotectant transport system ATP-binding protein
VQFGTPLHILSAPADAFVSELVGAEDVLRRLSLLTVGPVMLPPRPFPDGLPTLAPDDDLRVALTHLLRAGVAALPVCAPSGALIGTVTLDLIRELTQAPQQAAHRV